MCACVCLEFRLLGYTFGGVYMFLVLHARWELQLVTQIFVNVQLVSCES